MNQRINEMLIKLVAADICNKELSLPSVSECTDEDFVELYNLARAHDLAHIVGFSLINRGMLKESSTEGMYSDSYFSALFKYENIHYAFGRVCEELEKSGIAFIPLKGSVIRNMYPQPWMRTSCDIDILIHPEDVRKASCVMVEVIGCTLKGEGYHDICFVSPQGISIELHFTLLEPEHSSKISAVLDTVWEHASPAEIGGCEYKLDEEMFVFYHIAHMAVHFFCGGCGVRPFLDLWLIDGKTACSAERLLKKADLTDFAASVRHLSRVWFDGAEHDDTTLLMQEFILSGGCFGSEETRMAAVQNTAGSRNKYFLSRLFLPYAKLKKQYPILKKYPFLIPFCEICRLFSLLFGKKKKLRKKYMSKLRGSSDTMNETTAALFEKTGLYRIL